MKKSAKIIAVSLMFLSLLQVGYSQIPNGEWRDHFAYTRGQSLAISTNTVFCAISEGGMISYTKSTGEAEKLSKVTGLSDIDINSVSYYETANLLILGYQSGNVDLITSDDLINIPYIKEQSFTESKTINKIKTYDSYAYMACDFGIVVIDLLKHEVKDSYFFGPGGTKLQVNDLVILDNVIYAATEYGLYAADVDSPNLLDHSFWSLLVDLPTLNTPHFAVEAFNDKLFTVYQESDSEGRKIVYMENDSWYNFTYSKDTLINSIDVSNNQLFISGLTTASVYNESLSLLKTYEMSNVKQMVSDSDGTIYSASYGMGFLKHQGDKQSYISIEGPLFNPAGQVATKDDHVWITSGGPNNIYKEGGAHNFYEEKWKSVITGWGYGFTDVGNFYKIAYHPTDIDHIYASAYRYGLYELTDYNLSASHTYDNTELFQSTIASNVGVRIMGLDFVSSGDLWTIFDETDQPVYVLREDGEWENPRLNSSIFGTNQNFIDLVVTETDQVWILSSDLGIVVLQEESDGSISETAFTIKNQDDESISKAYCLEEDKNGNVWVGTNKGPLYYPQMTDIFERTEITANSVKIPSEEDEGSADYLLDYEIVNDIAVDGANRKWIATENSGVFLVSSDGVTTLHQFTFDNSALISNNVISIDVQEKTGEVFISTNKGIVSFMGTATEGLDDFTDVYVYPNPVRPEYSGDVTITGLIEDANVKITDISGNLVYETTSLGGQAIWDGKNFDGQKVSTGVYLVFMTNDDGTKTHITKLLFIN